MSSGAVLLFFIYLFIVFVKFVFFVLAALFDFVKGELLLSLPNLNFYNCLV